MSHRVDHLLALAKADPRLPLDLHLMAESVNVSVPHLCRLFKKETGISAARSMKLTKMEHSANLLTATFWTVKEIVEMCGFRDESHFVRDFKKIYGLTPTEYRKSAVSVARGIATGQESIEDATDGNGHVSISREGTSAKNQGQGGKPRNQRSKTKD